MDLLLSRTRPDWLKTLPRYGWSLLAWVGVMVLTPIMAALWGDAVRSWIVSLGVLLQIVTVVLILGNSWSASRTALAVVLVSLLAWGAEALGSTTGFPFGRYTYTAALQPQIGQVPLIIPLAWMMMLPPAWAVADRITRGQRGWRFALVSGLAFTAWDFFLDPQMVHWGFWAWQEPGGYFGIPWLNYAGWLVVSTLLTLIVRPRALPWQPLILIYAITWGLETIGLIFFWGLVGPGLVGFVAMGGMLGWAWRRRLGKGRVSFLEKIVNW